MVVKVASTSTKTSTEKVMVSATVTVVCYKWKTLSNGENPLMLRVTKEGMLRTYKTSKCECANIEKPERHNFQHTEN